MNQDIKKRWVEALRSGTYHQTQEALRTDEGFCCLGVLCDVVKKDLNVDWNGPVIGSIAYNFMGDIGELPREVRALCDFRCSEMLYGSPIVDGRSLVVMNDTDGNTFDEIADAIEKYL